MNLPVIALTNVASLSGFTSNIISFDWSPDNKFIVCGQIISGNGISVVQFSGGTSLAVVASLSNGTLVNSVNWALDGRTIVFGDSTQVHVVSFNGTSLTPVTIFTHGATVNGVNWAPDGQYVTMVGVAGTGGFDIRALQYTGNALTSISNVTHGATNNAVSWSQGGRYVAVGSQPNGATTIVELFLAYIFPSNTFIRNNEVFGMHGPMLATGLPGFSSGRGLSASSDTNMIIKNTALNNDISYAFVTNTYRQYLTNVMSTIPNNLSNIFYPPF